MIRQKRMIAALTLICLTCFMCWSSPSCVADDRHVGRGHSDRKPLHNIFNSESDDEGNETTGQIAAWLLTGANLTVALSIVIRWANRFSHLQPAAKGLLSSFNRLQKKHLMRLHYYLNPFIIGVALWHWFESRCQSTALPEWGLFLMVLAVATGILVKFKVCPGGLRKSLYQLHTQPLLFIALIFMLTVGHTIID